MSASGPVNDPKTFPAATLDDQDAIAADELGQGIIMGTPPHSSPDPATDGQRMLPLEDGSSAHDAALQAAAEREAGSADESADYSKMKVAELRDEMDSRGLDSTGLKRDDLVAALQEDDASSMKASDFKEQVDAATTQEELDSAVELYEASEKDYSTVNDAIERKQSELNEQ